MKFAGLNLVRNIVCYVILIGSFENVWSIVTILGCPKSRMGLTCGQTVGPTFLHVFWGWTNSWSTLGYKCHLDHKFLGPSLPRTKRVGRIVTRTKGGWTKHQGTVQTPQCSLRQWFFVGQTFLWSPLCRPHWWSLLTGVGYTGESKLAGVAYTGESRLPG